MHKLDALQNCRYLAWLVMPKREIILEVCTNLENWSNAKMIKILLKVCSATGNHCTMDHGLNEGFRHKLFKYDQKEFNCRIVDSTVSYAIKTQATWTKANFKLKVSQTPESSQRRILLFM